MALGKVIEDKTMFLSFPGCASCTRTKQECRVIRYWLKYPNCLLNKEEKED